MTWLPRRTVAEVVVSEREDTAVSSIDRIDAVDVFVGLDVGKGDFHAVTLDRAWVRVFDRTLPRGEHRLRAALPFPMARKPAGEKYRLKNVPRQGRPWAAEIVRARSEQTRAE